MLPINIKFLIIIVGIVIYFIKKKWLLLYWISIIPILFPILNLYLGINDTDTFEGVYYSMAGPMYNMLIVLIGVAYFRKRGINKFINILPIFLLLCIYLVIHNIITHYDSQTLFENIKVALYVIVPLILLLIDDECLPKIKDLFVFFLVLLVIQFSWCVLELIGIYPYPVFYFEKVSGIEENLVSGTFHRFNALTNFLTTTYLFICLDYYIKKRISQWLYILISMTVISMIVMSGSRMSIALFLYACFVSWWVFSKKKIIALIFFIALLSVSIVLLLGSEYISQNEGVNRIIEGMMALLDKKQETTASLSEYLLDKYFFQSPFIGNGLSWKGESAYGMIDGNYKADARFAFVLVEFGIIGTIIYFLFFYKAFRSMAFFLSANYKKAVFICYIYYLILSFTESGFFDWYCLPLCYLYFLLVRKTECKGDVTTN